MLMQELVMNVSQKEEILSCTMKHIDVIVSLLHLG